jgi:hypothetical protein
MVARLPIESRYSGSFPQMTAANFLGFSAGCESLRIGRFSSARSGATAPACPRGLVHHNSGLVMDRNAASWPFSIGPAKVGTNPPYLVIRRRGGE